jgi:hypothetical protein
MAAGDFTVPLREETPQPVLDALRDGLFGHVVVTPAWVDGRILTRAQLLSIARYTGVVRGVADNGRSVSGAGLAIWLGDEGDKGKLTQSATNTTNTFANWWISWAINGFLNGLTTGSLETLGSFKLERMPGVSIRVLADELCRRANAEWRVNPSGTIDAGTLTHLYPSFTTPTVVLTEGPGSRDVNVRGLPTVFDASADVEDYSTAVHVHYNNATAMVAVSSGVTPPKRLDGADVIMERVVEASDVTASGEATEIGTAEAALTANTRRQVTIGSDVYDIAGSVRPGDSVYLYSPAAGYVGSTQLPYRGQTITPATRRVYAVSWPLQRGMGVYLLPPVASPTPVDLTQWIEPEDGASTLEVGAPRRTLLRAIRRGQAA